jgi:hypothetical protein
MKFFFQLFIKDYSGSRVASRGLPGERDLHRMHENREQANRTSRARIAAIPTSPNQK